MKEIFNLLGCIFSIALGFFFPLLISNKLEKDNQSTVNWNYLVLTISVLGGISGAVSTIIDMAWVLLFWYSINCTSSSTSKIK